MQARLLLLLTLATIPTYAEWQFHAPYLGSASRPIGKEVVSLSEISEATKQADLIVLTKSLELDTTDPKLYRGRHQIVEIIKGRREAPIDLDWKPSATGIKSGSRHLFFLKQQDGEDELKALKEVYIHREGYPCCRTYGAMDGGTEATLAVVRSLLDPSQDQVLDQAKAELLREVKNDRVQRQHTAVLLATELNHPASLPALRYAVKHRVEGFIQAVYALCRLDGSEGVKAALEQIGELERYEEVQVFDAIAKAKNPASVQMLVDLGNRDPKQRVSCAFAIRAIDPKALADIVASWEADGKHAGQTEKFNGSGFIPTRKTSDLLKIAVEGGTVDPSGFDGLESDALKR